MRQNNVDFRNREPPTNILALLLVREQNAIAPLNQCDKPAASAKYAVSPMNRRIQMRKINVFAAALILIGLGAWVVTTNSRVAASTPVAIDPLQMMTGATNLPTPHYVDYEVIFN
jgi:hypothetical protein